MTKGALGPFFYLGIRQQQTPFVSRPNGDSALPLRIDKIGVILCLRRPGDRTRMEPCKTWN
ncbi:hypothetical protein BA188_06550 [Aeromonas hydrophila]|nr:hypothetical protein OI72_10165 [Aeromonas hydrophila]OFC43372.1 hypothetical protein BA189_03095 [Aeromonas hydrophila]OFC54456.1 hypothetical protein BA188_06550 [Aeromonas hydrophila]